jgi:hypothetical protein
VYLDALDAVSTLPTTNELDAGVKEPTAALVEPALLPVEESAPDVE